MTRLRVSTALACFAIALCLPTMGASQGLASSAPLPPTMQKSDIAVPDTKSDTAKGLEGRLFFSAEQRQRMDNARKRGLVSNDDGQLIEPPVSMLNGFVKRSDGNTAVWVDGVPRWNAKSGSTAGLMPTDVGGPAGYLKSTNVETPAPSVKPAARAKKVTKPRVKKSSAKKITKPRLLP